MIFSTVVPSKRLLQTSGQGDNEVYDMHRPAHHAVKIWMQKKKVVNYWVEG